MKLIPKLSSFIGQVIWAGLLVAVAALPQAWNMFEFPYYKNDEGTYMSQAWSVVTQGQLAPYTYWYDHAPGGWLLISLWTLLTGGFFTFGFSLNSGRVLMLVLHVASSFLLFYLTLKLTRSKILGFVSVALFSLSPLAIYFQRRVLLDNIMVFWLLVSIASLFKYRHRFRWILLSGLSFGLSVLSKETAVVYAPIFLYLLWRKLKQNHQGFALLLWIASSGLLISLYFLYALIKGELFPYTSFLGGGSPHVSLIEALQFQAGRGGGSIFDARSDIRQLFQVWYEADRFLVVAGIVALIGNLLAVPFSKVARLSTLLVVPMLVYLLHGGIVLEFYVIPLIPFVCLAIAVAQYQLYHVLANIRWSWLRPTVQIGLTLPVVYILWGSVSESTSIRGDQNLYTSNQTGPQIEAVEWILNQGSPRYGYIIDNYAYIELNQKTALDRHQYAEWYWKIDADPDVRRQVLRNNQSNIDIIAATPQMENDIAVSGLNITGKALQNARPIKQFWNDGWGVTLWATLNPDRILTASWLSYKENFIDQGRTLDPQADFITTSEGQSYSLLRAVWMDDRNTFDQVWRWTKNNLQLDNGLFIWRYDQSTPELPGNLGTATDADQDIALALIFASRVWEDDSYARQAQAILDAIWELEVYDDGDQAVILGGNWANLGRSLIINPSYLSPASYRIFAEFDPNHDWLRAVDTSYQLLELCTQARLGRDRAVLPPEWCEYSLTTGQVSQPEKPYPTSTHYSFNAIRIPWRIGLDYRWFESETALNYLESLEFLSQEWLQDQRLLVGYQHNGQAWDEYESAVAYGANLAYFAITAPETAQTIYQEKLVNKLYEDDLESYWEDPNNYYTQNWAWFGTAFYTNNLPNLYHYPLSVIH